MEKTVLFIDRDLSWLSFNERVMLEAEKKYTPTIEKLRFLAIYSSNLDEFYRVRIAAFQRAVSDAKGNPSDVEDIKIQLHQIQEVVNRQQAKFGEIYRGTILPELAKNGITIWDKDVLDESQKSYLLRYFQTHIRGLIHFQTETIFLENRRLYLAVSVKDDSGKMQVIFINIPADSPRFIPYPTMEAHSFMYLDDLIRLHLHTLVPDFDILNAFAVKMNRDAELYLDEEFRGDIKKKILKSLSKRSGGAPSRLLIDQDMPSEIRELIAASLGLEAGSFIDGARYHNYFDFFSFPIPEQKGLVYPKQDDIKIRKLEEADSLLNLIEKQDQLLHFPYHPYDYVLRLFNEAATDSSVTEIRATMYRMSSSSAIAKALINAARNGKKVVVFVELKARFDEQNNIKWSEKMETAGVKIIYSIPDIKVHAKVALISRNRSGKMSRIAFYGTGNFNEKTAEIYTDHALLTADPNINDELHQLLRHLENGKVNPKPKELLIARFNMVEKFMQLIDLEIEFARKGQNAEITIKLNNIQDKPMIRKLYEAAAHGVQVKLIIRGICCLNPDYHENISVHRVVGRFLEHGRIFRFENGGNTKVYLGSADWMVRNLHHRIEVIFPVKDERLQNEIGAFLSLQLSAHRGTAILDQSLSNKFPYEESSDVTAQEAFYTLLASKQKVDKDAVV